MAAFIANCPTGTLGTIMQNTYLQWVIEHTATKWWHDSAEEAELDLGLARGAVGVTTNPFLANVALSRDRVLWAPAHAYRRDENGGEAAAAA
jgi:hypothetical protein